MTRLIPDIEKLIEESPLFHKGGCLVPREGSDLPSSHENYFCICEMKAAKREGFRLGVEMAIETVMRLPVTRSEMVGVIEPVVSRIHALATPQAEKEDE